MQVFEMVTIIVVVSVVAGLIRTWIQQREKVSVDINALEKRLAKLEALEERIETLEKIVTDKNFQLKRKIDEL